MARYANNTVLRFLHSRLTALSLARQTVIFFVIGIHKNKLKSS